MCMQLQFASWERAVTVQQTKENNCDDHGSPCLHVGLFCIVLIRLIFGVFFQLIDGLHHFFGINW